MPHLLIHTRRLALEKQMEELEKKRDESKEKVCLVAFVHFQDASL